MGITETHGTVTTDGTLQQLFSVSALKHYAFAISCHNMALGDTLEVEVSGYDDQNTTLRVWVDFTLTDAQNQAWIWVPYITSSQYRVRIKRLAGTDRAYGWTRFEVS